MTIQKKLEFIQDKYFPEWLKTRREVADEISDRQQMFCVCGRLATGLHENGCRKLQNKITSETLKKLDYLINPVIAKV